MVGNPAEVCAFHWTMVMWTHVQQLGHFGSRRGHTTSSSSCWPCHSCRGLASLMCSTWWRKGPNTIFSRWHHISDTNDLEDICIIFIVEFNEIKSVFTLHLSLTYPLYSTYTGWHHHMNSKARGLPLPFYQQIPVIFREAELVQSRITATDLDRDVRRTSHLVQQKFD